MGSRGSRERVFLGFGLGAVLVAGGAVALGAGCSSSSNNPGGSTVDAASETSMTTHDASTDGTVNNTKDAGSDAEEIEAGPMLPAPKVFLVHASPDPLVPPLRFCFGLESGAVAPTAPLPDAPLPGQPFPGLYPGTGGELVAPDGIDITSILPLTVYAVSAVSIQNDTVEAGANEVTCENLIFPESADAGLKAGQDYFQLAKITKGELVDGNSYVVAITGCLPGSTDGGFAAQCGGDYSASKGNLTLTTFTLDSTSTFDAGTLGMQFAHASTAWDSFAATFDAGTSAGAFMLGAPPADAGADADAGPTVSNTPVAQQLSFGAVSPMTLQPVSGLTFDGTSGAFAAVVTSPTDVVAKLPLPFPIVDELTYGQTVPDGGAIQNGKGFVFVLVGDPTQSLTTDGGGPNLHAAHFLAFPTANP